MGIQGHVVTAIVTVGRRLAAFCLLEDEPTMNAPFSTRTRWFFHNAIQQESRTPMRIQVVPGIQLLGTRLGRHVPTRCKGASHETHHLFAARPAAAVPVPGRLAHMARCRLRRAAESLADA